MYTIYLRESRFKHQTSRTQSSSFALCSSHLIFAYKRSFIRWIIFSHHSHLTELLFSVLFRFPIHLMQSYPILPFIFYTAISFRSSAIISSASVADWISSIVYSGLYSTNAKPSGVTFITPISVTMRFT